MDFDRDEGEEGGYLMAAEAPAPCGMVGDHCERLDSYIQDYNAERIDLNPALNPLKDGRLHRPAKHPRKTVLSAIVVETPDSGVSTATATAFIALQNTPEKPPCPRLW